MKRGHWILLAALVAGLAGFAVIRSQSVIPSTSVSHGKNLLPELEWMRREFTLTDEQFAKVAELHLAYRPTCEALCARVMDSHEKIHRLVAGGTGVTSELEAGLREHAALHVECQTAMLHHLYRTAASLPEEKGKKYLETMLPHVIEMGMEPGRH